MGTFYTPYCPGKFIMRLSASIMFNTTTTTTRIPITAAKGRFSAL
jgi:hypothetical protein